MNIVQCINRAAYSMSDDQLRLERKVQDRLFKAVAELKSAVADVNAGSAVQYIAVSALEGFIHDEIPDLAQWDERIAKARAA